MARFAQVACGSRSCNQFSFADFSDDDLVAVIERAKRRGVAGVVVVSMDATERDRIFEICERFPAMCRPAFGLHPKHVTKHGPSVEDVVATINNPKWRLACVGECGLDNSPRILEGFFKGLSFSFLFCFVFVLF